MKRATLASAVLILVAGMTSACGGDAVDTSSEAYVAGYNSGVYTGSEVAPGVSTRDEAYAACYSTFTAWESITPGDHTAAGRDFDAGCEAGITSVLGEDYVERDESDDPYSETPTYDTTTTEASDPDALYLPDDWAHDPDSFAESPASISSGTSLWYDGLTWSGWGSQLATGKGLEHTSSCGSCPEDPGSPQAVTFTVSKPTNCGGRRYYTVIRVERPGGEASLFDVRETEQGSCSAFPRQ